ncbi:MAG: DUF2892 domain-containing protein [Candidatus Sericytochromatia bacterium]
MRPTLKTTLAATMAALTLTAAPAMAETAAQAPCCTQETTRVANWVAPLDDRPYQNVRLFGIVEAPANEGVLDRALRLVAGAGLVGLAAADPLNGGTALRAGAGVAGGVLLWTSLTGACPAYMPFGWSTREQPAH